MLIFGAFKWYQRKVMTMQRKKRLAMSARFALQANSMYGIQESSKQTIHPNIVMYTVQNMPPKKNLLTAPKSYGAKKGFQGTLV